MPQKEIEPLQIPIANLRFRKILDEGVFALDEPVPKFRLSVKIINTTLNTDVVHEWIGKPDAYRGIDDPTFPLVLN